MPKPKKPKKPKKSAAKPKKTPILLTDAQAKKIAKAIPPKLRKELTVHW